MAAELPGHSPSPNFNLVLWSGRPENFPFHRFTLEDGADVSRNVGTKLKHTPRNVPEGRGSQLN